MAKKDMGACMSEWKDKHPQGRANKKMSKEDAHKQAVAACLNKTEVSEGQKFSPSKFGKSANAQKQTACPNPKCGKRVDKGDIRKHDGKEWCSHCDPQLQEKRKFTSTFKDFLREVEEMNGMDVRGYIRSLPMYQELIKNPQTKPQALALARSLTQEFGAGPADRNVQGYISDEFDDMYRKTFKQGANIGDWEGEADYQAFQSGQAKLDKMADEYRKAGLDPETGEELPPQRVRDQRGRLQHGARSGMEFRPEIKAKRAAQDLLGQGARPTLSLRNKATSAPAGEGAYVGGESKAKRAASIVADGLRAGKKPSEIKQQLRDELDMTAAGSNTYFYKYKAQAFANRG